jgi:hypothetical protein
MTTMVVVMGKKNLSVEQETLQLFRVYPTLDVKHSLLSNVNVIHWNLSAGFRTLRLLLHLCVYTVAEQAPD